MPYLDVSDVLLDPTLAMGFSVIRRVETIGNNGRASLSETRFDDIIGVVTSSSRNDLQRLPEDQRAGRHLTVITKFRLQAPTPGKQPDVVVWGGNRFVVKELDPYPQYGAGFIQAIVGSMDSIDEPVV